MSNRPEDITPEEISEKEQYCKDCIVALITVEKGDSVKTSFNLSEEIAKMCQEVGHRMVVLLPFAHLSNNLANTNEVIKIISSTKENLSMNFDVLKAHFGSHKQLLLDIYGHPGNARYREF